MREVLPPLISIGFFIFHFILNLTVDVNLFATIECDLEKAVDTVHQWRS